MAQEKALIEDSMLQMAQGMKELASGFTQQLKSDDSLISKISSQQDINLVKT